MTTIVIALPDDRAKRLEEEARRRGITPEELAKSSVETFIDHLAPLPAAKENLLAEALRRPPGSRPVTDEQIEQLLVEKRMRHLA